MMTQLAPFTIPAPVWEWRSFELPKARRDQLLDEGDLEDPGALQAEIQLLVPASSASVKLRRGRIEVKERIRRHGSGVERWRTTITTPFPLSDAATTAIGALLCMPRPMSIDARRSPEDFLAELPFIAPDVTAVPLRAWRRIYRWHGGQAEIATLVLADGMLEEIVLNHREAGVLLEMIADVGGDVGAGIDEAGILKARLGWGA